MINWVAVSNIFYFHPNLGKWSNLTNVFQMGWNHQPVNYPFRFCFFFFGAAWNNDVSAKIIQNRKQRTTKNSLCLPLPLARCQKGKLETLQMEGPLSHYRSWARSRCLVGWDCPKGERLNLGMTTSPYGYIGLGVPMVRNDAGWYVNLPPNWFGGERLGRYMVLVQESTKGWYLRMEVLFSNMLCK